MIKLINELVECMSKKVLQTDELIAKTGTAIEEKTVDSLMPVEIKPFNAKIQSAWLAIDKESNSPYLLSLKPAGNTIIKVSDLKKLFGNFTIVDTDRGRPRQIVFYPKKKTEVSIAVATDVIKEPGFIEDSRILNISIRREVIKTQ